MLSKLSLAIAKIFGGFPASFFSKYHELLPRSEPVEQYELRVDLYELFHYLNHALIFGSVSILFNVYYLLRIAEIIPDVERLRIERYAENGQTSARVLVSISRERYVLFQPIHQGTEQITVP